MTTKTRQLGRPEARALIADRGFGGAPRLTSAPTVGVELESFTVPARHPSSLPVPVLPRGSRLTFEPGGQVEISSPPSATVGEACCSLAADLIAVSEALSPLGVRLVQQGTRSAPPRRLVDDARYRATESYVDTGWPSGRVMMCSTASVQVNLGLGAGRWRAANVLGLDLKAIGHLAGARPLELRMIDALPDPWWRVPVAVAAALVDDDEAVDAALGERCLSVSSCWCSCCTQSPTTKPPASSGTGDTLWTRVGRGSVVVASEPYNEDEKWSAVPDRTLVVATADRRSLTPLPCHLEPPQRKGL